MLLLARCAPLDRADRGLYALSNRSAGQLQPMPPAPSTAGNTLIGIDTRPKGILPQSGARAAIARLRLM